MGAKKTVTDTDVQALKKLLSGTKAQVLAPSDHGYAETIVRWSRAAEKPAGVSILPTTSEETAIAVKYATEHDLDIAVMGGGHSTAGASSTDGGVLIHLSKMRAVRVDPQTKLVYVQGGALWSDVDEAAWEHGLATVGGTVADTGVGGLTLGGGYGHATGTHGLVIDNTVGATTVLADGSIVESSKEKNPDLFWALMGAGQNFGVSTEFIYQAFSQPEIFTGIMLFPPAPEIVAKVIDALNDLYIVHDTPQGPQTKAGGKAMTLLALAKPPPAGGQTLLLCVFSYNGTEAEGKEAFKPFYDIGPIHNTLSMQPWPKVNTLAPAIQEARSSMKGAAFLLPIRPAFVSKVIEDFDTFTTANPDASNTVVGWEVYDAVKTTELQNGSYANRGYHMNAVVMPTWFDKVNDQACRQWARDVSNLFKTELEEVQGQETGRGPSRKGHKGGVMLYGNYDQYDEISKDIFGDNYERLQQIKAKYDPTNMFNKLFAITPAAEGKL